MRQVKFRAWNPEDKRFESLFLVNASTGMPTNLDNWSRHEWILNQYTGMDDCNGTMIYEDDIVRNEHGDVALMQFDKGIFSAFKFPPTPVWYELEVIGNIYQNENLLK